MSSVTAATLADRAVRLGLLNSGQLQSVWDELGTRNVEPDELLQFLERKGLLTPFQTNKLERGDKDGYFLGGYRILYKIASGSFGRVFRADDPTSGRVVALKVLRRKWTEDKRKIELFMREGKMGMALHHPNIVEILAVNHDKPTNQYYIVMEFVEGGNLRDFVNIRKKLQPVEIMRILEESAAALSYAFSRGVTHRDMKLTNILLSSQGPVKMVDFGLAGGHVGFEEKEDTTVDRTVDYAGLEKATSAPHGDIRSDIFFLGCVAYELLTGRSPLDMSRSATSRMSAQRFSAIPPIKPDEVECPPSVIRLVENMMALQPVDRIQTPSQLVERVREVRGELEGRTQGSTGKAQRSIFIAERDENLQDVLRTKLKERGFRVLIAGDPARAVDRFRQQPYDMLIVDAVTTGEEGFHVFERVLEDARRQQMVCRGILMLADDQLEWKAKVSDVPGIAVLTQPIKFRKLVQAIDELLQQDQAEANPPAQA